MRALRHVGLLRRRGWPGQRARRDSGRGGARAPHPGLSPAERAGRAQWIGRWPRDGSGKVTGPRRAFGSWRALQQAGSFCSFWEAKVEGGCTCPGVAPSWLWHPFHLAFLHPRGSCGLANSFWYVPKPQAKQPSWFLPFYSAYSQNVALYLWRIMSCLCFPLPHGAL